MITSKKDVVDYDRKLIVDKFVSSSNCMGKVNFMYLLII